MSTPARHGQPWSDEEIQKLLQAVKRKQTHEQIAESHQRSTGGIRARLRQLAADYYFNDSRPIEEIIQFTGLDKATILDTISRRQNAMEARKEKMEKKSLKLSETETKTEPQVKREYMTSLLVEIRDMMKEMLEIMREKKTTV